MESRTYDQLLLKIVDELKKRYDCHTIILYGSRARGDATIVSDYDLMAIRDKGEMERDCRKVEGAYLDAFIYSIEEINHADHFLRIKDGLVLCQKDKIGDNLLQRVKDLYKKGPTPKSVWEKQLIKIWGQKMLERAKVGDIEGNFRAHWLLYDLLESYFQMRDKWYLGPKEAFQWLKEHDPSCYTLFERTLKESIRLNELSKLSEYVADSSVQCQKKVMLNIRLLTDVDIPLIVSAFSNIGWNKPVSLFQKYLQEQQLGTKFVWISFIDGHFSGYVTLELSSEYQPFYEKQIPEIKDLNVLPHFRNQGIGSSLLKEAENKAKNYSAYVGIGVGLFSDYGDAQKLYVKKGYIPDGKGVTYQYKPVKWECGYKMDDNLVLWFTKKLNLNYNEEHQGANIDRFL